MITAVVPAAGRGVRLRYDGPKALAPIAGRPMIVWSLDAIAAVPGVVEIIVAAPEGSIDAFEEIRRSRPTLDEGPRRQAAWTRTVVGGATRTESVSRLLDHVTSNRVLVHDAARPCVSSAWIADLLDDLGDDPAGVPSIPITDTLKSGANGLIVETVSREGLYAVQTPQIFDLSTLRRAHAEARERGGRWPGPTDDAALVERISIPVRLLRGDPLNVKVTYEEDVGLAQTVLGSRVQLGGTP